MVDLGVGMHRFKSKAPFLVFVLGGGGEGGEFTSASTHGQKTKLAPMITWLCGEDMVHDSGVEHP